MEHSISPMRSTRKTYKLRGTLVNVDVTHQIIVIQPSEHDGKRVRRLTIRPDSEILAGTERKALADLTVDVGEWVSAHYVKEDNQAVLKTLHVPRSMTSSPPTPLPGGSQSTPAGSEPLPKAS